MNHQQPETIVVSCPLCSSMEHRVLFEARDRLMNVPGTFAVVACSNCGCQFTNPRPSERSLLRYYPTEYAPYATKPPNARTGWKAVLSRLFHAYMYPIDVVDPLQVPGQRLLEVGCAAGAYLHTQKKYGLELFGIKYGEEPARYAREVLGLNVIHGELVDGHYADKFFDGAVAWMVLEHINNPRGFLRELHRVLKPGAVFTFSIPNSACWESRVFKSDWYALDVPRHLTHFSRNSMARMLEQEGFRVDHVWYQRNLDTLVASVGLRCESIWGSSALTQWFVHFSDHTSPLVRFVLRPMFQPVAYIVSWLHQSSCLTVVAHRT